jgi:hypothetical protein
VATSPGTARFSRPHSAPPRGRTPVDRRTFLGLLARAGGGCAALAAAGAVGLRTISAAGAVRDVANPPANDGIVALGRAYLRAHPDEADLATLKRAVPGLAGDGSVRERLPDLAGVVADDFAAGRVVTVDGWQLAASEARAAAAVALGA